MSALLLFVRRMKHNEIYDRQGNKLGTIEDVMLDGSICTARYAVLGFHSGLDSKKLFAVPLNALAFDSENECFILDVPKQRLRDADGFAADSPPAAADPLFSGLAAPQVSARSASGVPT